MNIPSSSSWSDPRSALRAGAESASARAADTVSASKGDAGSRRLAGADPESDLLAETMLPSEAAELSISVARAITGNWSAALAAGAGPALAVSPGLLESS
jgi:hypothetical protein